MHLTPLETGALCVWYATVAGNWRRVSAYQSHDFVKTAVCTLIMALVSRKFEPCGKIP